MVLIGLLCDHFFDNLTNVKYPKHVISVSKSDILNIKKNQIFTSSDRSEIKLLFNRSIET